MGYSRGRCVQSYDDDGVNEKDLLGLKATREELWRLVLLRCCVNVAVFMLLEQPGFSPHDSNQRGHLYGVCFFCVAQDSIFM